MTGWRHTDAATSSISGLTYCTATVEAADGGYGRCVCTTPDPDPASPCGFEECPYRDCAFPHARYWHAVAAPLAESTSIHHRHVPTLCRCGHRIEETT